MASAVSICSNALQMLGADPISSFEESKPHARTCGNLYPTLRDTILRAHTWNCATKRLILAPEQQKPEFDFNYQFLLPGDWLRTIQVGKKGQTLEYRSEGKRILANVNALPLVYIFRNEDEASWSSNLIHVMEKAVAANIAYNVTASASMRDSMIAEFERALKIAKAIDGQDDPPEEFAEGSFLESRFV